MIAQNVAALHGERVISLASIMSSSGDRKLPLPKPHVLRLLLSRPPKRAALEQQVRHFVRLFRAIGSPGFPTSEIDLAARMRRSLQRSYAPAGTLRQLLAVVASADRSALLERIAVPTLVVHGDMDRLVPLPHGQDCARKIRDSRLVVIPGFGHDIPDTVVPVLCDVLIPHLRASGAS
jgi:pimeloyl-ACP methyl ester carboxylesterase